MTLPWPRLVWSVTCFTRMKNVLWGWSFLPGPPLYNLRSASSSVSSPYNDQHLRTAISILYAQLHLHYQHCSSRQHVVTSCAPLFPEVSPSSISCTWLAGMVVCLAVGVKGSDPACCVKPQTGSCSRSHPRYLPDVITLLRMWLLWFLVGPGCSVYGDGRGTQLSAVQHCIWFMGLGNLCQAVVL